MTTGRVGGVVVGAIAIEVGDAAGGQRQMLMQD